jgi:DDE family transposase
MTAVFQPADLLFRLREATQGLVAMMTKDKEKALRDLILQQLLTRIPITLLWALGATIIFVLGVTYAAGAKFATAPPVSAEIQTRITGLEGDIANLQNRNKLLNSELEHVNDAERLRHDPARRWIVGGKAAQGCAASPSQIGRFETQWLAAPENLSAIADLSGQWIDLVHGRRPPRSIVLDKDSSVSPTHGEQEMSAWNGHYACTCYHPLFVFNQFGDLERCALRPGNVHSADGWDGVLKPVVARYQGKLSRIYFRADAALAMPEVYEFLETKRIK